MAHPEQEGFLHGDTRVLFADDVGVLIDRLVTDIVRV
jgi:hypothetical protein